MCPCSCIGNATVLASAAHRGSVRESYNCHAQQQGPCSALMAAMYCRAWQTGRDLMNGVLDQSEVELCWTCSPA